MRHQKLSRTLGRQTGHRWSMMRNMATSLIKHKRIQTTDIRAKELSRFVDKLVTWAKQKDLAGKREVFRHIKDRDAAKELFDVIAPGFENRAGGYTRILKYGMRRGDGAPVSLIEFVEAAA